MASQLKKNHNPSVTSNDSTHETSSTNPAIYHSLLEGSEPIPQGTPWPKFDPIGSGRGDKVSKLSTTNKDPNTPRVQPEILGTNAVHARCASIARPKKEPVPWELAVPKTRTKNETPISRAPPISKPRLSMSNESFPPLKQSQRKPQTKRGTPKNPAATLTTKSEKIALIKTTDWRRLGGGDPKAQ